MWYLLAFRSLGLVSTSDASFGASLSMLLPFATSKSLIESIKHLNLFFDRSKLWSATSAKEELQRIKQFPCEIVCLLNSLSCISEKPNLKGQYLSTSFMFMALELVQIILEDQDVCDLRISIFMLWMWMLGSEVN